MYQSHSNNQFDKADIMCYEEVTRMPPFKRKTLVLIGSQGVGRRTLKNRLINSDPNKFGTIVPCKFILKIIFFTGDIRLILFLINQGDANILLLLLPGTSRPPRVLEENGRSYWFVDRETMENEIREHKFLEHGEHNGHLYGTHLDTIRDVIKQGLYFLKIVFDQAYIDSKF